MLNPMLQRALALHQNGRVAEAENLYRQAIAMGAGGFQIHHMLAVALYQQQKFPEALAAVQTAMRSDPQSLDGLMLQAVLLQATGRPAQALESFTKVTSRQPGNADAWYNRGVVLDNLGRLSEAIAAFDKALALQPSPMAWNNRGSALQRLGRLDEALDSIDRALALAPGMDTALYNRALVLRSLQRTREALAALDGLLARTPAMAQAWLERGGALFELNRFEDAVASYERALALAPESAKAWVLRGVALQRLRRLEDALASLDQALVHNAGNLDGLRLRAEILDALKRSDEAVAAFDLALAQSPKTAGLHAGRAVALNHAGRFDDALASYDRALKLEPGNVETWHNRAVTQMTVQRFDAAMESLQRGLALAPDSPLLAMLHGKLLCETGSVADGLEIFSRRAARLNGDSPSDAAPASEHKQRHDAEQRAYLAEQGLDSGGYQIVGGERIDGPAVNPLNREIAATQWAASDPKILVIDNLLTPEALEGLRRFCWGSTVWRKPYRQGYLGAFNEHGFACPLLAQIADELREVFPSVVADHGLVNSWGFKYDSSLSGIRIHADQAAVNVNFWITPDEANLNPASGGMVIWDKVAPMDWDITRYNGDDDAVRAFLAETEAKAITVPYRANRAVIFDSDLFHETDRIEFAQGYLNRRINVTMLYGRRNFTNR